METSTKKANIDTVAKFRDFLEVEDLFDEFMEYRKTNRVGFERATQALSNDSQQSNPINISRKLFLNPEDIPDSRGIYLVCARGRQYSRTDIFKKISLERLVHEYTKFDDLKMRYSFEEIGKCFSLSTETKIFIAFERGKKAKDHTISTYYNQVLYDLIHIFRYAEYIECSQNKCKCRLVIPTKGFYAQRVVEEKMPTKVSKENLDSECASKKCRLTDPKTCKVLGKRLILFEEEESDLFRICHNAKQ